MAIDQALAKGSKRVIQWSFLLPELSAFSMVLIFPRDNKLAKKTPTRWSFMRYNAYRIEPNGRVNYFGCLGDAERQHQPQVASPRSPTKTAVNIDAPNSKPPRA